MFQQCQKQLSCHQLTPRLLKSCKNISGIGLLELMLSLSIIAVLLIMATRYFESASRSEDANQGLAMVQAISAAAANYKVANPSYTNISIDQLCQTGTLPDVNCPTKGGGQNPWGGTMTVSSSQPNYFTLQMNNVPDKVCRNMQAKFNAANQAQCTVSAGGSDNFTINLGDVG